jgi:hypothetical protein
MLIRSEKLDSTSIRPAWSIKRSNSQLRSQATRNSVLTKSKDGRADATSDNSGRKRGWRSAEYGKLRPMAEMPQAAWVRGPQKDGKSSNKSWP